jgi:FkbM family methyltransferase
LNRYLLYLRRFLRAREFGIGFSGTSYTPMPKSVRIAGGMRAVHAPADPTLVHDVINLWLDDEYGLRRVGHPVRTIVDIGANIGLFSLFARHCFPAATIHAYEPDPEVLTYTARNFDDAGIELFPEAVSHADGCADMVRSGSSRVNQVQTAETGEVTLTSLRSAVARIGGTVDLLKLDCEGFEWDIFEDAQPFAAIRSIRMEYHLVGGRTVADLEAIAPRLGFTVTHLRRDDGFGIAWMDRAASHPLFSPKS